MNIFVLDTNTKLCAEMHCDKHVVKMILEYCQLMSTACHVHGFAVDGMYKKTHVNHPCAIWARENKSNFEYLLNLTIDLLEEYTFRYGKIHASSKLIPLFIDVIDKFPEGKMTEFALCMDDEAKINGSVVDNYRNLYKTTKRHMCTWKVRPSPTWWS